MLYMLCSTRWITLFTATTSIKWRSRFFAPDSNQMYPGQSRRGSRGPCQASYLLLVLVGIEAIGSAFIFATPLRFRFVRCGCCGLTAMVRRCSSPSPYHSTLPLISRRPPAARMLACGGSEDQAAAQAHLGINTTFESNTRRIICCFGGNSNRRVSSLFGFFGKPHLIHKKSEFGN
jgi:hypothetical protein